MRSLLFITAVTLSAFLVFSVQPIFGKLALPILGGSSNVWITVMLFFQSALLAGYGYAHLLYRLSGERRRIWLHGAFLLLAALALPLSLNAPENYIENPVLWLLGAMTLSVGAPFAILSASAPLMQRFYAESALAHDDPYFLYSASNLGSILALLSYPYVIERFLAIPQQSFLWAVGYGCLVLILACCVLISRRYQMVKAHDPSAQDVLRNKRIASNSISPLTPLKTNVRSMLAWIFLAALPSSLLLGTTTRITTDIASAPLLWVLPLVVYLLTYVIAFARRPLLRHEQVSTVFPIIFVALVLYIFLADDVMGNVIAHLLLLFCCALLCHGELVRQRPRIEGLTLFFLCLSLGGAVGGLFNAIIAPQIFDNTFEYQLALLLVLGCWRGVGKHKNLLWVWSARPLGAIGLFTMTVIIILVFSHFGKKGHLLAENRNFFGILNVAQQSFGDEIVKVMNHGTTLHGAQRVKGPKVCEPLLYYHPEGPAGDVFESNPSLADNAEDILLIGLGVGALFGYAEPHQRWTVIEIDPAVIEMALNPDLFTFITECSKTKTTRFLPGDGRIELQRMVNPSFDIIVLDAYSSDSVPIHLATLEAFELYIESLGQNGVLLIHATNRYLALDEVFATQAETLGLSALIKRQQTGDEGLLARSTWIAIAQNSSALDGLAEQGWKELIPQRQISPWTDSYSEIISIIK